VSTFEFVYASLYSEITFAARRVGVGAAAVGGAIAVSASVPDAGVEPNEAVIFADPALSTLTVPFAETVATAGLEEVNVK
jgi:hypothetical protein